MPGRRVHVGRNHVRLDLVGCDAARCARVIQRVEHLELLESPRSVSPERVGQHGPKCGVGVLRAVLPYARQVSLDVSRVVSGVIERRGEQQKQTVLFDRELFFAIQPEGRLREMIARYDSAVGAV